ncbi:MAG TPA: ABC transporter permease [bacterium]|nr:ABC transporter permease [bacterium]
MKITAFLKKDFLVAISYRFAFVLQFISMLVYLLILYYIGQTFSGAISPHLERYGGDYFPYVLVGIAVTTFVTVGLGALAQEVRSAQVQGTLEALLCTPVSIYTVLIGNSLWAYMTAFVESIVILVVGFAFLGLKLPFINFFFTLLVLALTFFAFLSVGMLSAAFIMIFKRGNPIKFIFGTSSYFLGGVLFPVEVLPKPFQFISTILPITHAIKALRELLLVNVQFQEIIPLVINLIIFIVIMAPLSIFFFKYAVKRAKRDGSLIQF